MGILGGTDDTAGYCKGTSVNTTTRYRYPAVLHDTEGFWGVIEVLGVLYGTAGY